MSLGTTEATTAPCSAWKCVGALGVAAALLYLSSSGSAESQTVSLVTSSAVKTQGTTRVAPPVVAPAQSVPVAPAPQAPGAGVRSAQRTELHTIRSSAGPTASDFLEGSYTIVFAMSVVVGALATSVYKRIIRTQRELMPLQSVPILEVPLASAKGVEVEAWNPLGLGKTLRCPELEELHGRWALMGAMGCVSPELLEKCAATFLQDEDAQAVGSVAMAFVTGTRDPLVGLGRPHAQPLTVRYGLFGLGGPEIAVIVATIGFVMGPKKLTEWAKDAGKMAGELKEVPNQFTEGMQEAKAEAAKLETEKETKELPGDKAKELPGDKEP